MADLPTMPLIAITSALRRVFTAVLTGFLVSASVLPAQEARLSNLAIRAQGGGGDTLITGFTVGEGPAKRVLIRAVGPTLGAFGVGGALADPKLELFAGGNRIAENDNWRDTDAGVFASVGAFPLGAGSRDAALVADLAPGSYTAQVTAASGAGVTLVEVYEVAGGATRLVNLSTRAQVGTGGNILIPGITIGAGSGTRRLLIRAVGPTLGAFGVGGVLADPKLELFNGATKAAENDNWETPAGTGASTGTQVAAASAGAGAFALVAGSRDAALLANLGPGSYTLQVSGVGETTGAALVEVYDITPAAPVLPAGVAPSFATQPVALTVGRGQDAVFAVAATGTPAPVLQWRRNGTPIAGANGPTLRLSAVDGPDAARYDVVATNAAGSATSAAAGLTVTGGINATVALQASATALVAGQSVTLRATVTGAAATSYSWYRDGRELFGSSGAVHAIASASELTTGVYLAVAKTAAGAIRSPAVTLAIVPGAGEISLVGRQFYTTTAEGTGIGTLRTIASDGSATVTYSLVAGPGDGDNARFGIAGSELRTAALFNGQAREAWSIRVRAADAAGRTREQAFTLTLVDARRVPGILRTLSDPVVGGLPFPVVESRLYFDFDVEAPVITWYGEKGGLYAIEYSANGTTGWQLVTGARALKVGDAAGVQSHLDLSADIDTPSRYYRVRRIDGPVETANAIVPPAADALTGLPAITLAAEREIILAPSFDDFITDGSGRAAYFEIYVPGSIGLQARTTERSFDLPISRNYRQGETLKVSVYGYSWSGQLVAALTERSYRVRFDEADFPFVSNHGRLVTPPVLAGIVNVYGSGATHSLQVSFGRQDRSTGSWILDLIFDRADGSEPNYGSFRLLLPRSVNDGVQTWTSLDAYNRSSTGACTMETGYTDNVTLAVGGNWASVGDFRWSSLGPNSLGRGDNRSYGAFDIKRIDSDTRYRIYQINVLTNGGGATTQSMGVIHFWLGSSGRR